MKSIASEALSQGATTGTNSVSISASPGRSYESPGWYTRPSSRYPRLAIRGMSGWMTACWPPYTRTSKPAAVNVSPVPTAVVTEARSPSFGTTSACVKIRTAGCVARAPAPMNQTAARAAPGAGAAAPPNPAAPAPAATGGPGAVPAQLPAIQRSIVYNGSITVRVDNVNTAADKLIGLAAGAGGFVGGDQRSIDADQSTATITLRIPAEKFSKTLEDVSHVGTEEARQVSTQDVTANVVDLAARIQAQQASVDRVRALLAKAQTIGEVTSVESELYRRDSDLESLQGQKRALDDLTALSTIAVTLLGKAAAKPVPPKQAQGGFLAGLKSGWKAFTASIKVILTVLGALLPFAIVIGVPVWLVLWWLRRRTRAATTPQLSSATTAPKSGSEG